MRALLLTLFAALVVFASGSLSIDEKRKFLQQKLCHTHSDCVTIVTNGRLLIDELDFFVDTPATLVERLPDWLGPARPLGLSYKKRKLVPHKTFFTQGVPLAADIELFTAAEAEL